MIEHYFYNVIDNEEPIYTKFVIKHHPSLTSREQGSPGVFSYKFGSDDWYWKSTTAIYMHKDNRFWYDFRLETTDPSFTFVPEEGLDKAIRNMEEHPDFERCPPKFRIKILRFVKNINGDLAKCNISTDVLINFWLEKNS